MPLTPFFRTPFTDFTGGLINAQHYDKCGQFELDVIECLEAYGQDRGKLKCRDLIEDFNECLTLTKRTMRAAVSDSYALLVTLNKIFYLNSRQ
jgi:NADH dehydrogenase (ubiquinone) Fe-S protein 5